MLKTGTTSVPAQKTIDDVETSKQKILRLGIPAWFLLVGVVFCAAAIGGRCYQADFDAQLRHDVSVRAHDDAQFVAAAYSNYYAYWSIVATVDKKDQ